MRLHWRTVWMLAEAGDDEARELYEMSRPHPSAQAWVRRRRWCGLVGEPMLWLVAG